MMRICWSSQAKRSKRQRTNRSTAGDPPSNGHQPAFPDLSSVAHFILQETLVTEHFMPVFLPQAVFDVVQFAQQDL